MSRKGKGKAGQKQTAESVWARYAELRDGGHLKYVEKAEKCERFFHGEQWDPADAQKLKDEGRPALTINKILATVSHVMGEQIYNRTDISFRPRNKGATEEVADALTKVYMQIADNNQLAWVRSDVFTDGIVTSRGFFDVRLDFSDNMEGDVRVTQLNPKDVLIDKDADAYDPNTWADVIVTRWLSLDEITVLYGADKAKKIKNEADNYNSATMDELESLRDRFGEDYFDFANRGDEFTGRRNVRVVERQRKILEKCKLFVDTATQETRLVPDSWEDEQIQAFLSDNPQYMVTEQLRPRIRWTVVAHCVVLYDEWSPYDYFTVVPYFPYFRRGQTTGLVENLIGPQELLNKVSSQELHVINTTANSGWIIKDGALSNMDVGELEQRGAETGLVIEVDDIKNIEKITPNQTPTGLDRITYKAEESIKEISGVTDYMKGQAREDVSARAVQSNQAAGSTSFAAMMDNLRRTDYYLARLVLHIVQRYYTEERLVVITGNKLAQDVETLTVNEITPEGMIVRDLTLGEYAIIVTNEPERETFEDSQFDQIVSMRQELGIAIPDTAVIEASRLRNKTQLVQEISGQADPEQAAYEQQIKNRQLEAETAGLEGDAALKNAQAQKTAGEAQQNPLMIEQQRLELERERMQMQMQLEREKAMMQMEIERMKANLDIQLKQEEHAQNMKLREQDAAFQRVQQQKAQAQQAQQPNQQKAKPAGDK